MSFRTTIAADETPMLVVHDEGDDEAPYSGGLAIAHAWPASRLFTTTGLGHRRILRDEGRRLRATGPAGWSGL